MALSHPRHPAAPTARPSHRHQHQYPHWAPAVALALAALALPGLVLWLLRGGVVPTVDAGRRQPAVRRRTKRRAD
jgi:hypothetical protein